MNKDFWDKSAVSIVIASYAIGLLAALAIVGWQVFHWLRTSVWIETHFYDAFTYFGIDLTSVYWPTNWLGLAKVAQWLLDIPLSIAMPVIIISVAHIWREFVTEIKKPRHL